MTSRIDKNREAVNNRYLDFVQARGLISLVNNNHVVKNLKEVNNRPKNCWGLKLVVIARNLANSYDAAPKYRSRVDRKTVVTQTYF